MCCSKPAAQRVVRSCCACRSPGSSARRDADRPDPVIPIYLELRCAALVCRWAAGKARHGSPSPNLTDPGIIFTLCLYLLVCCKYDKSAVVTFQLNKESPVPLHTQLLNELRRAILTQELKAHTRIGSEPELARTLNISRTT